MSLNNRPPLSVDKLRMENRRDFKRKESKVPQNATERPEKPKEENPNLPVQAQTSVGQSENPNSDSLNFTNDSSPSPAAPKRKVDDDANEVVIKRKRIIFDDSNETLNVESVEGVNAESPKIGRRPRVIIDSKAPLPSVDASLSQPKVTSGTFLNVSSSSTVSDGAPPFRRNSRFQNNQGVNYQNNRYTINPDRFNNSQNFIPSKNGPGLPNGFDNSYQHRNRFNDTRRDPMRPPFQKRRSEPYTTQSVHSHQKAPVIDDKRSVGSSARTPAQNRMLRIKASLSAQSTPVNQPPGQNSQSWPRDNRRPFNDSSAQANASMISPSDSMYGRPQNSQGRMSQSPSPSRNGSQNLMSPRASQNSIPTPNSQMSCSSILKSSQNSSYPSSSQKSSQSNNEAVFAHPSNSWSSPVLRERSSSASSGMSVDSPPNFSFLGASKKSKEQILQASVNAPSDVNPEKDGITSPCTTNSTEVDSQESMEWETVPTAVIVDKVRTEFLWSYGKTELQ